MGVALGRVIWGLHTGIVGFVSVGWALPWRWAGLAILIGNPLIQLNWWIFGRCALSILEEKLSGGAVKRYAVQEEAHLPRNFTAEIASRVLGRPMSMRDANVLSYGVLWGGFAVAGLRYALGHYR